jgi:hypothetical protein
MCVVTPDVCLISIELRQTRLRLRLAKLNTGIQKYINPSMAAEVRMGQLTADFGKTAADYGKHRAGFSTGVVRSPNGRWA